MRFSYDLESTMREREGTTGGVYFCEGWARRDRERDEIKMRSEFYLYQSRELNKSKNGVGK